MLGISRMQFWRLLKAAKAPAPMVLGATPMWSISELTAWVEAGMPARDTWEEIKAARS